ncbi:hypothetical protein HDU76_010545, partial [Blyttiomyces sp. JEL0837]
MPNDKNRLVNRVEQRWSGTVFLPLYVADAGLFHRCQLEGKQNDEPTFIRLVKVQKQIDRIRRSPEGGMESKMLYGTNSMRGLFRLDELQRRENGEFVYKKFWNKLLDLLTLLLGDLTFEELLKRLSTRKKLAGPRLDESVVAFIDDFGANYQDYISWEKYANSLVIKTWEVGNWTGRVWSSAWRYKASHSPHGLREFQACTGRSSKTKDVASAMASGGDTVIMHCERGTSSACPIPFLQQHGTPSSTCEPAKNQHRVDPALVSEGICSSHKKTKLPVGKSRMKQVCLDDDDKRNNHAEESSLQTSTNSLLDFGEPFDIKPVQSGRCSSLLVGEDDYENDDWGGGGCDGSDKDESDFDEFTGIHTSSS